MEDERTDISTQLFRLGSDCACVWVYTVNTLKEYFGHRSCTPVVHVACHKCKRCCCCCCCLFCCESVDEYTRLSTLWDSNEFRYLCATLAAMSVLFWKMCIVFTAFSLNVCNCCAACIDYLYSKGVLSYQHVD